MCRTQVTIRVDFESLAGLASPESGPQLAGQLALPSHDDGRRLIAVAQSMLVVLHEEASDGRLLLVTDVVDTCHVGREADEADDLLEREVEVQGRRDKVQLRDFDHHRQEAQDTITQGRQRA